MDLVLGPRGRVGQFDQSHLLLGKRDTPRGATAPAPLHRFGSTVRRPTQGRAGVGAPRPVAVRPSLPPPPPAAGGGSGTAGPQDRQALVIGGMADGTVARVVPVIFVVVADVAAREGLQYVLRLPPLGADYRKEQVAGVVQDAQHDATGARRGASGLGHTRNESLPVGGGRLGLRQRFGLGRLVPVVVVVRVGPVGAAARGVIRLVHLVQQRDARIAVSVGVVPDCDAGVVLVVRDVSGSSSCPCGRRAGAGRVRVRIGGGMLQRVVVAWGAAPQSDARDGDSPLSADAGVLPLAPALRLGPFRLARLGFGSVRPLLGHPFLVARPDGAVLVLPVQVGVLPPGRRRAQPQRFLEGRYHPPHGGGNAVVLLPGGGLLRVDRRVIPSHGSGIAVECIRVAGQ
mmetsp:Transcript_30997/g.92896  ORF Transcript_30997/g.92896 Transcript_30997/m.92896 type:complete len:400 (-) Transcript_30997:5000-6199(-)